MLSALLPFPKAEAEAEAEAAYLRARLTRQAALPQAAGQRLTPPLATAAASPLKDADCSQSPCAPHAHVLRSAGHTGTSGNHMTMQSCEGKPPGSVSLNHAIQWKAKRQTF